MLSVKLSSLLYRRNAISKELYQAVIVEETDFALISFQFMVVYGFNYVIVRY